MRVLRGFGALGEFLNDEPLLKESLAPLLKRGVREGFPANRTLRVCVSV